LRRGDLAREPSRHLRPRAAAEEWLEIELDAERVPQLLATAVMKPGKLLVRGEAERNSGKELECRGLLIKVPDVGVAHVGDTRTHRIEALKRAHQRADRKHLDFDPPTRRDPDCL